MVVKLPFDAFYFFFRSLGKGEFEVGPYYFFPVSDDAIYKKEDNIGKCIEQPEWQYGDEPQQGVSDTKYQQIHWQNICANIVIFGAKHDDL